MAPRSRDAITSVSKGITLNAESSRRRLCTAADGGGEFSGKSAYEVLGVSESSSFAEIKASFRKLAKENHPDVVPSPGDGAASQRFLQILAAYEILSDSRKRVHYDSYLFAQRKILRKKPGLGSVMYTNTSSVTIKKQSEVVEWLKVYRLIIDDILTEKKVVNGSGYFDELEGELYSAIRAAYYGPLIESIDLLPECFEAEERSTYGTSEVLHLVSGRDLFGIVCLADKVPELSNIQYERLTTFNFMASGVCQFIRQAIGGSSRSSESVDNLEMEVKHRNNYFSDSYKDLTLHISGSIVATATRSPPKCKINGIPLMDSEDQIHVFLSLEEHETYATEAFCPHAISPNSIRSRILLGTITGLGTSAEEGICSVYDRSGTKTHVIMKHRTLMVKHMHWYQFGDQVSGCECRCSRARLPPSRFWLFEPRCSMHDIGGWYIETFGRDKKGRTIPSQRQWSSMFEHHEKRLHPAMYLLALAYRTLDLEDAKRRKQTIRDFLEPKLHSILRWCKKHL